MQADERVDRNDVSLSQDSVPQDASPATRRHRGGTTKSLQYNQAKCHSQNNARTLQPECVTLSAELPGRNGCAQKSQNMVLSLLPVQT